MIKLSNQEAIRKAIVSGLRDTIMEHGMINKKLIGSAAKRILGKIKTHLYNTQIQQVKKVRIGDRKYKTVKK